MTVLLASWSRGAFRQLTFRQGLLLAGVLVSFLGCKKEQEPAPIPAKAAPSAALSPPRCEPTDALMTLGTPGDRRFASEEDEEEAGDLGMPFGVQLGGAVALDRAFALGALVEQQSQTHAVVALFFSDKDGGRTVDLGRVIGDVVPPALAEQDSKLFVAFQERAASGSSVRLARIDGVPDTPVVVHGGSVDQTSDDSPAFDLAVRGERGVLVWDDWLSEEKTSAVRASVFSTADLSNPSTPSRLSRAKADAEGPRIVARKSGFFVAWTEAPEGAAPSPAAGDPERTVVTGRRFVVLSVLDEAGIAQGVPLRVTPQDGHVVSFDLVATPDEGALVAWREDSRSLSTAGGVIRIARVRPGGSVETRVLAEEGVGATTPSLLVDLLPSSKRAYGFIAFAGEEDATRLGTLDADGLLLDGLENEPKLFGAVPLAVRAGRLLVARPRGKGAELNVLLCKAP